jgi:hypothetical protein
MRAMVRASSERIPRTVHLVDIHTNTGAAALTPTPEAPPTLAPLEALLALLGGLDAADGPEAFARRLAAECSAEVGTDDDYGTDDYDEGLARKSRLFARLDAARTAMLGVGVALSRLMNDDDAITLALAVGGEAAAK